MTLCYYIIYVYNTCVIPNMGICGNVRSEKPMPTALRDLRAKNMPRSKGEDAGSQSKFSVSSLVR